MKFEYNFFVKTLSMRAQMYGFKFQTHYYSQVNSQESDFAPQVSATCKAGSMNIKILFNSSYNGAVHARDYRNPYCMTFGNGSNIVTMSLNLKAIEGSNDFCGILVANVDKEVNKQQMRIPYKIDDSNKIFLIYKKM